MEKGILGLILLVLAIILLTVLLILNSKKTKERKALNISIKGSSPEIDNNILVVDTTHPMYGVKGWLKFFIVVNIYIAPVLFVVNHILAWVSYIEVQDDYPDIIISGAIFSLVGVILVIKWIQIGINLREIRAGAVHEAKDWLRIALLWTFIRIPLEFVSGIESEYLLPGIMKNVVLGLISFSIWYSYFNVSKRVRATYADWNK